MQAILNQEKKKKEDDIVYWEGEACNAVGLRSGWVGCLDKELALRQ